MSLDKFKTEEELKAIIETAHQEGKTVVFTNGCFDLLHVGHVRYLRAAAEMADLLVLAVNSDKSVRDIKEPGRPFNKEADRVGTIAALECVDYVTLFSDSTVDRLLEYLRPDIQAKGTDYTVDTIPERETMARIGGKVAIAGDPKDHSSTDLVAAAKAMGKGQ